MSQCALIYGKIHPMSRKIAILLILLVIPFISLRANASDEKGWYPFMENKGWYGWGGQSGSASSTGDKDQPLVQPTTQPTSSSASTQPMTNTPSQTGQQQQSSFFK